MESVLPKRKLVRMASLLLGSYLMLLPLLLLRMLLLVLELLLLSAFLDSSLLTELKPARKLFSEFVADVCRR